jgi:hypothetical protein
VDEATERIKKILDAKYEKADMQNARHLDVDQQQALKTVLVEFKNLFDGTLGHWITDPYVMESKVNVKPSHAKPFPIPKVYKQTLRMEKDHLVQAGVLRKMNRSEWAAPAFIIPKQDNTVRFISDFRELNKRIKRKPFPIPKIQDLLLNLEGFQYVTSLDLNMGY